ncbi:MAG: hypothetical protein DRG58_02775 [Deltaproteobacteria bacterium]|nr:MAG: hypothetical protein DRG58_02775 [Deltaproteobacteria bacterium]
MEITAYNSYWVSSAEVNPEEISTPNQSASQNEDQTLAVGHDRVDVVQTQNLAASETEALDLDSAWGLLEQLQQELPRLQDQELAQLYRYEHLRTSFAG